MTGEGGEEARQRLAAVVARLDAAYGRPLLVPRLPPVDELVYTVLSQNTADVNTDRTFSALKARYPDWAAVRDAPLGDLVATIAHGGLAQTKAPRLKRILTALSERTGRPDLSCLEAMDDAAAIDWLTSLPGVGPKTAACVLLFSLGRPVMPVDTHVHRVSRRLGLIPEGMGAGPAHAVLTRLAGPDPRQVYAAHVGMVRHGRRVCRARRPDCPACVLRDLCPAAA